MHVFFKIHFILLYFLYRTYICIVSIRLETTVSGVTISGKKTNKEEKGGKKSTTKNRNTTLRVFPISGGACTFLFFQTFPQTGLPYCNGETCDMPVFAIKHKCEQKIKCPPKIS